MNAPIVAFKDGTTLRLDRELDPGLVADRINREREAAGSEGRATRLLEFQDDDTPSRPAWLDPAEVRSVR